MILDGDLNMSMINVTVSYYKKDIEKFTKNVKFEITQDDFIQIKMGQVGWFFDKVKELLIEDFLDECMNLKIPADLNFFESQWQDVKIDLTYFLVKELEEYYK